MRLIFGTMSGDSGFDARADFDRSGQINVADFSLLASNFGKAGNLSCRP